MGLPGRRVSTIAALALATVLAVLTVAPAESGSAATSSERRNAKPRVFTDGTLTVGAQETLTVTHVPRRPHRRLKAFISAPPTATSCYSVPVDAWGFSACLPQPLHPVPGTPPLKANKKNRGSLTFVMPPGYEYIDYYDPLKSHPIYLVNGQSIWVDIEIIWKPQPRTTAISSLTSTSAVVEVPPAS
jgi:hypothetical protein